MTNVLESEKRKRKKTTSKNTIEPAKYSSLNVKVKARAHSA